MAISYKNDYGADVMDFGLIDWFGSSGNSGGAGGTLGAGAGAGIAIGTMGALLAQIGKEKWDKIFGEKGYIKPTKVEDIKKNENVVANPAIPSDLKWEMIQTLPEKNIKKETITEKEIPKAEENPKVETETGNNEDPKPPILSGEEKMEDNTFTNLENAITPFDPLKWAEDQQAKIWEREDAIRAETQAREDNAYQRAIEDMQKAGINPNLLGSITPAGSGGGITNATPADTALAQKQMEKDMELLKQSIDQAFKEDQNQKDRVWSLIEKILGAGAMLGGAAIR